MITEVWIDSDYLEEIWDSLDTDKIQVRAKFDHETREAIKFHYKEIALLKQKEEK